MRVDYLLLTIRSGLIRLRQPREVTNPHKRMHGGHVLYGSAATSRSLGKGAPLTHSPKVIDKHEVCISCHDIGIE